VAERRYSCFLENFVHTIPFLLQNKQKTHAKQRLQKVLAAISVKSLLMKREGRQAVIRHFGRKLKLWTAL